MFCEDYPVLYYTHWSQSSSSNVNTHSIVPWHSNLIANLSENRVYTLSIFASNASVLYPLLEDTFVSSLYTIIIF